MTAVGNGAHFVLQAPLGRYYGFPSDRGEGFKIGKYHLRVQPVPDPDHLDREISPEDEAGVREGIAAYFPEANGPARRIVACMFTTSPDEHFILDRHPAVTTRSSPPASPATATSSAA